MVERHFNRKTWTVMFGAYTLIDSLFHKTLSPLVLSKESLYNNVNNAQTSCHESLSNSRTDILVAVYNETHIDILKLHK